MEKSPKSDLTEEKRGRKEAALKSQVSNRKPKELVKKRSKLIWLFSKHRSVQNDWTLGLRPDPQELDIQRPNDEKFDVSAGLSDPKRKVARKPQGLDLLLDRRIQLKLQEEKKWWIVKVYSNMDTSGKILLKSTETMANVKVIKAKKGPKKLARQPFINVPEGLIHASQAQILSLSPVVQRQGEENIKPEIEIEIPEILNPGFSSSENVPMAKRGKFSNYVIN